MSDKLKVRFVPFTQDISVGTYRIWIKDYCSYMEQNGIDAKIIPAQNIEQAFRDADVIILGKGGDPYYLSICEYGEKNYPQTIIGTITPPSTLKGIPFDFVMAGSPEEADSLSFHKNTIINAHIESLYYTRKPRTHHEKDSLVIGVHGWSPHLSSFVPHLKYALEEFEKDQDFELRIFCENKNFVWNTGRPDIKNITFHQWEYSTIADKIIQCDIGLVPGVTDLTQYVPQFGVSPKDGLFDSDCIFRFKNKCNNGRALVFHFLGVPIVADFSPSHFHLLGDGKCGYLANTKDGWLYGLNRLKDYKKRANIAHNAYLKTKKEYDPFVWAQNYYDSLDEIHKQKGKATS